MFRRLPNLAQDKRRKPTETLTAPKIMILTPLSRFPLPVELLQHSREMFNRVPRGLISPLELAVTSIASGNVMEAIRISLIIIV